MFAKNLEYLLAELSCRSDVAYIDPKEFETRFDSLRRYGKLPAGRDNRGKSLTASEIAAAVFGLVSSNPNWAGHAAILLADLRPVGGATASFREATTLSAAVEQLLGDAPARSSLVRLDLSVAEHATNSNGSATLLYQDRDSRRVASFVSSMAYSQLQPGAETAFDRDFIDATMARSISLNRRFFDKVSSAIARSLEHIPL